MEGSFLIHMYAKVFRQIFDSSIAENPSVRFTFMDMLVLADCDGVVDRTHEAIARITNRPIEEIRSTIAVLEGPDPKSRTPDENGARILRLDNHRDWGWIIVNYDRFRDIASEEQRRKKTRDRVNRFRAKRKKICNAPVTLSNDSPYAYASPSPSVSEKGDARGKRFPGSIDDAIKLCGNLAVPKEFVIQCFNKADSRGGLDGRGIAIQNFQSYVCIEWKYEQDRRGRLAANGDPVLSGADKINFGKEYERVDQAIRDLRASYGDHQAMTGKDREKMGKLLDRRKELRKMLGVTI